MNDYLRHMDITSFQRDLLHWYEENKRDLPWRKTQDPYRVWVSEVMLQQTKVDTVIPYYHRFLESFPTLKDLAEAREEEVMKAWEGLGYYSRARHLHQAVKEVVENYGGEVPHEKKAFSSLKGVGPYTAGAVLSIAFEQPEPAIDGNVMRVFSRLLLITEDITKAKTRKIFEEVIPPFLEEVLPSEMNQALMELGAIVCFPTSPHCLLCPVERYCMAREEGVQEELPVKAKKRAPKVKKMAAVILKNEEGKTLFHQRPDDGLLATLWEYPNTEIKEAGQTKETLTEFLSSEYEIEAIIGEKVQEVKHVFTHLIWEIEVYEGIVKRQKTCQNERLSWLTLREATQYAFPVSHQKILKEQKRKEESADGLRTSK